MVEPTIYKDFTRKKLVLFLIDRYEKRNRTTIKLVPSDFAYLSNNVLVAAFKLTLVSKTPQLFARLKNKKQANSQTELLFTSVV